MKLLSLRESEPSNVSGSLAFARLADVSSRLRRVCVMRVIASAKFRVTSMDASGSGLTDPRGPGHLGVLVGCGGKLGILIGGGSIGF